jgi:hypothetical protein
MAQKTLTDMLAMLRKAGVGEGVDTCRAEIRLSDTGRMSLRLTHQSSGIVASVLVQPDYTVDDRSAEEFEREVAAIYVA